MKKFFSFLLPALYKMLCHFSIAFSGIILVFCWFIADLSNIEGKGILYERLTGFAIFALVFGISSIIFSVPKLPNALKTLLHFVVGITAFLSTVVFDGATNSVQVFVLAFLFTLIYAVIFGLSVVLRCLLKPKKEISEETDTEENV